METKTVPLLTGMMIGELNKSCTFREISEPDELENAFRFRYEEYIKSRLFAYIKCNNHCVDIDTYDLHSKHYGLFRGNSDMIGYLRVVLDKREYYNQNVFKIGKRFDLFSEVDHSFENLKNSGEADYPFLSYPSVPESIQSFYYALKARNESFAEASRLIIKKDFRGMRSSLFLFECALVLFLKICQGSKYAVVHCCKDHGQFYKRFGFLPFDGNSEYNEFGVRKVVLFLSRSIRPNSLPSRLEDMVISFSTTCKIERGIY